METEGRADPLSLQRVQSLLLSLDNLTDFLAELSKIASSVLDPPASCGITVRRDGQPMTVTSSDERAAGLDESQYTEGSGPCLQAMNTSTVVDVPDLLIETRWPAYTEHAASQGLKCSLSLPLIVGETTLGAMNLYEFERADMFSGRQRQRCEVFAGQAAGAMQVLIRHDRDAELLNQLEEALRSRSIIDQAIGILMAQQRCGTSEAFGLLRRRSQSSQTRLRDVAADLVERVTGQAPDGGRPFDR